METEKIISCCGIICSECEYYPVTCAGCPAIEGKVFWLEHIGANCCPIYHCSKEDKELPHCGHCSALPCGHYELQDPGMTPEENKEALKRRLILLEELRNTPGTEQPRHLFSENAIWKTRSEYTDSEGHIKRGVGESEITIAEDGCIHCSTWTLTDKRMNDVDYQITPISGTRFKAVFQNPSMGGDLEGYIDVAGPRLYFKFFMRDTEVTGFMVVTREGSTSHARGVLYNGDDLLHSWSAKMTKQ